jgi:hypothetical protein
MSKIPLPRGSAVKRLQALGFRRWGERNKPSSKKESTADLIPFVSGPITFYYQQFMILEDLDVSDIVSIIDASARNHHYYEINRFSSASVFINSTRFNSRLDPSHLR